MRRFASPLLVGTIGLAAAAPFAAAAPLPTPPPATTPTPVVRLPEGAVGEFSVPEDARYYSDLLNLFAQRPLVLADGAFGWGYSRQRTADDARALGLVTAAPAAPGPGVPPTQLTYGTFAGTTALRAQDVYFRELPSAAADGGTWIADTTLTPRPARTRLLLVNDRAEVIRRIALPKDVSVRAIVPTTRGLRVVGVQAPRKVRGAKSRVVISGPGVRSWTRDPYLTPDAQVVSAPLADGSLLVSGASRAKGGLPDPVLRVSPGGRISRLADRRKPDATVGTREAGIAQTSLGAVMVETSAVQLPAADVKDAVVVRGSQGQVVARRLLRDLDFGFPAVCRAEGAHRRVAGVMAGPDGLPVLDVRCVGNDARYEGAPTYRHFPPTATRALVGLGPDLRSRWTLDATSVLGQDGNMLSACTHDLVGADGRLWSLSCGTRFIAVDVPGATMSSGKLVSSRRDGKLGVTARISCRAPWGARCSGTATATVGGVVVGTAKYTVAGGPGRAAGILDRHIATTSPVKGKFSIALEPRS